MNTLREAASGIPPMPDPDEMAALLPADWSTLHSSHREGRRYRLCFPRTKGAGKLYSRRSLPACQTHAKLHSRCHCTVLVEEPPRAIPSVPPAERIRRLRGTTCEMHAKMHVRCICAGSEIPKQTIRCEKHAAQHRRCKCLQKVFTKRCAAHSRSHRPCTSTCFPGELIRNNIQRCKAHCMDPTATTFYGTCCVQAINEHPDDAVRDALHKMHETILLGPYQEE